MAPTDRSSVRDGVCPIEWDKRKAPSQLLCRKDVAKELAKKSGEGGTEDARKIRIRKRIYFNDLGRITILHPRRKSRGIG